MPGAETSPIRHCTAAALVPPFAEGMKPVDANLSSLAGKPAGPE
jgi:hypothetical protein